MRIHREGYPALRITTTLMIALLIPSMIYRSPLLHVLLGVMVLFTLFAIQFFRSPRRPIDRKDPKLIYAPADGKVVVIENTLEREYLKDKRLQISIFMSPLDVHVNRIPVAGKIAYKKYHSGKYLVAWHPKSSMENEHNTVAISAGNNKSGSTSNQIILLRQIAGAVARRIECYVNTGDTVEQGDELGFIKFGSRCDIFLPLDAEVMVNLNERVKANTNVLARLP